MEEKIFLLDIMSPSTLSILMSSTLYLIENKKPNTEVLKIIQDGEVYTALDIYQIFYN